MPRAKVLILSFSRIASDPRVRRQTDLLKFTFELTVVGFGRPSDLDGVEFLPVQHASRSTAERLHAALRLKLGRYRAYYWSTDSARQASDILQERRFDLIIANDSDTWPLANELAASHKTPVLCDAHEYSPREFEDIAWWRFLYTRYRHELCRRELPRAAGVLTVCDGIADEYARVFGIRRPVVVANTPPLQPLTPAPVAADRVRMVHHGGAARSRRIENMIRMFDHLDDRFSLDLILVASDPAYLDELKSLARDKPGIRFLEPIPMAEIPSALNTYDLGLYLLEPNSFNNRHALPNKFFEFVQARLAVAIGPSPEMARIVREHGLGLVADDFSPAALAASLNTLTPARLAEFKAAAHRAAPQLSWDNESGKLLAEVSRILALRSCAA